MATAKPLLEKKYGMFDESAPYPDGPREGPFEMKVNDQLNKKMSVNVQWVLTALIYVSMTFYLYFNFFEPFEVNSLPYKICVFLPVIITFGLGAPLGFGMVGFLPKAETMTIILSVVGVFLAGAYGNHIPYLSAYLGGRILPYFFENIWRAGCQNHDLEMVFSASYIYPFNFAVVNTGLYVLQKNKLITENWRWGIFPFVMGFIWATLYFILAIVYPQPTEAFSTYKLNKAQYCRLCTLRYGIIAVPIIGVCRPLEMILNST